MNQFLVVLCIPASQGIQYAMPLNPLFTVLQWFTVLSGFQLMQLFLIFR